MEELKTLKDIKVSNNQVLFNLGAQIQREIIIKEAIKYYKYYDCEQQIKNKKNYRDFLIICKAKKELLVEIFNLTEEDLK